VLPNSRAIRTCQRGAVTALTLGLLACSSSDDKNPVTIDPPTAGVDSVAVALYVQETDGELSLHWIGSPMGPLAQSPEQTAVAWIGFGAPFELRWFIGSEQSPVVDFRWKASQIPSAPFVPAAVDSVPTWSSETRAFFANDTDPAQLIPSSCPDGEDCPSQRRWEDSSGGPYRFQLEGRDQDGRVQHFEFEFHVNYPPDTRIVRNGLPPSQSGVAFPRYWYFDDSDNWVATHFAEGDTIPSGSYAVFAVDGTDRLASEVQADSFCCDLALSSDAARLKRQWRAQWSALNDRGESRSEFPTWSISELSDTLGFFVGPFDYHITARARDEHDRSDPTPDEFDFVAGFAPRIVATAPVDGDMVLLGPDGSDPASSQSATATPNVIRYWDTVLDQYWTTQLVDTQAVAGTVFVLPLNFESAADPRQHGVLGDVAGRDFGSAALGWTYEYLSEFDPDNFSREGNGDGDLRSFVDGSSSGFFTRANAIEIFVPNSLWDQPEFFDPDGACLIPEWCDQGAILLRNLGRIGLTVMAKDTSSQSKLSTYPVSLRPSGTNNVQPVNLSELGRRSELVQDIFEVRLVVGGAPGQLVLWPPRP
jgi:hypothetical protein